MKQKYFFLNPPFNFVFSRCCYFNLLQHKSYLDSSVFHLKTNQKISKIFIEKHEIKKQEVKNKRSIKEENINCEINIKQRAKDPKNDDRKRN